MYLCDLNSQGYPYIFLLQATAILQSIPSEEKAVTNILIDMGVESSILSTFMPLLMALLVNL